MSDDVEARKYEIRALLSLIKKETRSCQLILSSLEVNKHSLLKELDEIIKK